MGALEFSMERWLGAGRLDTSRGSRFMRADADVDTVPGDAVQTTVEGHVASSSVDGQEKDPAVERAAALADAVPSAEHQLRAALSPPESRRNAS
jgi:hypothetical protein